MSACWTQHKFYWLPSEIFFISFNFFPFSLDYYGSDKTEKYYKDRTNADILASDGQNIDVNEFIIGVIENFREDMLTGIPELKVPILDPFKSKKPALVNVEDSKATVHGNFSDIYVEGEKKVILWIILLSNSIIYPWC